MKINNLFLAISTCLTLLPMHANAVDRDDFSPENREMRTLGIPPQNLQATKSIRDIPQNQIQNEEMNTNITSSSFVDGAPYPLGENLTSTTQTTQTASSDVQLGYRDPLVVQGLKGRAPVDPSAPIIMRTGLDTPMTNLVKTKKEYKKDFSQVVNQLNSIAPEKYEELSKRSTEARNLVGVREAKNYVVQEIINFIPGDLLTEIDFKPSDDPITLSQKKFRLGLKIVDYCNLMPAYMLKMIDMNRDLIRTNKDTDSSVIKTFIDQLRLGGNSIFDSLIVNDLIGAPLSDSLMDDVKSGTPLSSKVINKMSLMGAPLSDTLINNLSTGVLLPENVIKELRYGKTQPLQDHVVKGLNLMGSPLSEGIINDLNAGVTLSKKTLTRLRVGGVSLPQGMKELMMNFIYHPNPTPTTLIDLVRYYKNKYVGIQFLQSAKIVVDNIHIVVPESQADALFSAALTYKWVGDRLGANWQKSNGNAADSSYQPFYYQYYNKSLDLHKEALRRIEVAEDSFKVRYLTACLTEALRPLLNETKTTESAKFLVNPLSVMPKGLKVNS